MAGQLMHNITKVFSFSSILAVCGTILTIYNHTTFGIVLVSLGILGSILRYSVEFQKETKEREEREKLYENIGKIISPQGQSLSTISQKISDALH